MKEIKKDETYRIEYHDITPRMEGGKRFSESFRLYKGDMFLGIIPETNKVAVLVIYPRRTT